MAKLPAMTVSLSRDSMLETSVAAFLRFRVALLSEALLSAVFLKCSLPLFGAKSSLT
jgi:hypothetical protein